MARCLHQAGIPVTLIVDCAVACSIALSRIDMILVGAKALVENGGIINRIGTYQIGLVAEQQGIPLYVAAESFKVWLPHSCCHKLMILVR